MHIGPNTEYNSHLECDLFVHSFSVHSVYNSNEMHTTHVITRWRLVSWYCHVLNKLRLLSPLSAVQAHSIARSRTNSPRTQTRQSACPWGTLLTTCCTFQALISTILPHRDSHARYLSSNCRRTTQFNMVDQLLLAVSYLSVQVR